MRIQILSPRENLHILELEMKGWIENQLDDSDDHPSHVGQLLCSILRHGNPSNSRSAIPQHCVWDIAAAH